MQRFLTGCLCTGGRHDAGKNVNPATVQVWNIVLRRVVLQGKAKSSPLLYSWINRSYKLFTHPQRALLIVRYKKNIFGDGCEPGTIAQPKKQSNCDHLKSNANGYPVNRDWTGWCWRMCKVSGTNNNLFRLLALHSIIVYLTAALDHLYTILLWSLDGRKCLVL